MAWGDTETVNILSENYESYSAGDIKSTMQANGWTFQNKNGVYPYVNIVQGTGDNTSKHLNLVYSDGGAERNQYWSFPSSVTSALTADNWSLTFDLAIAPGGNQTYELAIAGTSTSGGFNANTRVTGSTTFFDIVNSAAGSTTYSAKVAGADVSGSFTLTSGTWYKVTVSVTSINTEANTATVYAKITSYDGNTTIMENTQSSASMASIGTLKGLTWWSPKTSNSTLNLDNVLLTKDVDASVCADPTYVITAASGTDRKFTLACETASATIYFATSELAKGADGWTTYSSEETTSATTIYAYAEKGSATSNIISFATGAGTAVTLNTPVISRSSNTSVTITSDQTDKIGSPATNIYYIYNGGDPVQYSGAITVAADATITAYATATGYTNSDNVTRAVALFPTTGISQVENSPATTSGYTSGAFNATTTTTEKATYAAYELDGAQWGTNVYFQTTNWGFRNSGNWFVNSTANTWLLMKDMKAGDIIVANTDYQASSLVNATYTEKYSFGNARAYTVIANGDVELAFKKPDSKKMHYFYGIYAYTHSVTGTAVGALDNSTADRTATSSKTTLKPGESYHYTFKNYNSGGNANWNNFVLLAYDSNDEEMIAVRADNFEIHAWKNSGFTNDFNWTNFVSKMNGATVDMTVSYSTDNVFNMSATITTNEATPATWNYSYTSDYTGSGISLAGNIKVALSVDHAWLDITEEGMTAYAVTIPSSGYGSLAVADGLDFSGVDGLTAFVATKTTAEKVKLESVTELPGSTGMILKGTAGTIYSIPVKSDATFGGTNYLSAAVTATDIAANTAYILQGGQLHLVTEASTVPAGKAYLLVSNVPAGARSLAFTFEDEETTDIVNLSPAISKGEINVYNLNGQRVQNPQKGLFIVNGKKMVIK